MKFSEAIAKLEENPELKFEATDHCKKHYILGCSDNGYFRLDVYLESGERIPQNKGGGAFNGNIRLDYDWQPVIEPVDFITAINSGKRIKPLHSKNKFVYPKCWLWRISHNYNTSDKVEDYWLDFINGQWVVEP